MAYSLFLACIWIIKDAFTHTPSCNIGLPTLLTFDRRAYYGLQVWGHRKVNQDKERILPWQDSFPVQVRKPKRSVTILQQSPQRSGYRMICSWVWPWCSSVQGCFTPWYFIWHQDWNPRGEEEYPGSTISLWNMIVLMKIKPGGWQQGMFQILRSLHR